LSAPKVHRLLRRTNRRGVTGWKTYCGRFLAGECETGTAEPDCKQCARSRWSRRDAAQDRIDKLVRTYVGASGSEGENDL